MKADKGVALQDVLSELHPLIMRGKSLGSLFSTILQVRLLWSILKLATFY